MNKFTKGAIATGAAVILLMGGAGTLAYWNDSAEVLGAGQTITSGNLDVAPSATAGSWSVKPWTTAGTGAAVPIATIANFRMVPGDVVEYVKSVDIVVTGTTIQTKLSLAAGSITSTSNALSTELASATSITVDGTLPAGVTAVSGGYKIVPGTYTLPIKVVIDWEDAGTPVAGSENLAKNQSVTFGEFAVNLEQVFS